MSKRTFVKLTFNANNAFDREILEYLEGKRGKAGEIKKLAYNSLFRMREAMPKAESVSEGIISQSAPILEVGASEAKYVQAEDEFSNKIGAILKFQGPKGG